jgi:hypothetical protein
MREGSVVFLSASLPYRAPWTASAQPAEIQRAIVSIARAVFARGGRLLFGGHPSVSPLIADIAGEYYPVDARRTIRPIVTVQSEFFKDRLPEKTWDLYTMGWSAIEWTPAGQDREDSLTILREAMLGMNGWGRAIAKHNELSPPVAMFAVGGMEGVRDEAAMFLQASTNPSVFLLKTPGACAAILTEPSDTWRERLWPPDRFRGDIFEALLVGKRRGKMVNLEQKWKEVKGQGVELPDDEVQPYGTMVQWALDELLHA